MGGLAVRAWLAAYASDDRVRRVITIGTPHRGTLLGRFGYTRNAREMCVGSAWQQRLAAKEPQRRFERFTCFFGHCDNVVFPASAATLPGADNHHLEGVAHVHMADRGEVFDELLRWTDP
jgi:triacylglycerol esterase/lipase EstA (alpha/beta hydrolase family)